MCDIRAGVRSSCERENKNVRELGKEFLGLGLKLNPKGLIFDNTFLTLELIFLLVGGTDVIAEYFIS
jgi:hypothetical protein